MLLPVGGFGEVGRNCLFIQDPVTEKSFFVDTGILVRRQEIQKERHVELRPDIRLLDGILNKMSEEVQAIFISHGHNDHVAAAGYVSNKFESPIPAFMSETAFQFYLNICRNSARTEAFQRGIKRGDPQFQQYCNRVIYDSIPHNLRNGYPVAKEQQYIYDGRVFSVGNLNITFFSVNHSIPESFGMVIEGNGMRMVFLPDFKLAGYCPEETESFRNKLHDIAEQAPVDLLVMDALYASVPGFTREECLAVENIEKILVKKIAEGKTVYIAYHGSNLRLMSELNGVVERVAGMPPAFVGAAMKNAARINGLDFRSEDSKVVFCTGCQAENGSALVRLASELGGKDVVILSSGAIPGNEDAVRGLANLLNNRHTEVILNVGEKERIGLPYNCWNVSEEFTHVSGHEKADGKKWVVDLFYKANDGREMTVIPYHAEGDDLVGFMKLVPEGAMCKTLNNGETFTI